MDNDYETDFHSWAITQSALLRAGRLADADIENIAEEVESIARREKRELATLLSALLTHLLKWQTQPTSRCAHWQLMIQEQRLLLESHLADSPSLQSSLAQTTASAHRLARLGAARETGLELASFPTASPWQYAQIVDPDFWPT